MIMRFHSGSNPASWRRRITVTAHTILRLAA
jgi:hypothetical protein